MVRKTLWVAVVLLGTLLATPHVRADGQFLQTKFGSLAVSAENLLHFNGKLVSPGVKGNSGLSIERALDAGSVVYVIVANYGGTACEVLYNIITVDKNRASASPTLGNCQPIGTVQLRNQSLRIETAGESYVWAGGVLTANGQVLPDRISSKPYSVWAVINDPDGYTNVRQAANAQSRIIARVEKGDTFLIHQQAGDWWQVDVGNGVRGYMHKSRVVMLRDL